MPLFQTVEPANRMAQNVEEAKKLTNDTRCLVFVSMVYRVILLTRMTFIVSIEWVCLCTHHFNFNCEQQPKHQIQESPICTKTYLVCARKSSVSPIVHSNILLWIHLPYCDRWHLLPQPSTLSSSLMVRNNLLDKTSFSVWHVALNFYENHLIRIRTGSGEKHFSFALRFVSYHFRK